MVLLNNANDPITGDEFIYIRGYAENRAGHECAHEHAESGGYGPDFRAFRKRDGLRVGLRDSVLAGRGPGTLIAGPGRGRTRYGGRLPAETREELNRPAGPRTTRRTRTGSAVIQGLPLPAQSSASGPTVVHAPGTGTHRLDSRRPVDHGDADHCDPPRCGLGGLRHQVQKSTRRSLSGTPSGNFLLSGWSAMPANSRSAVVDVLGPHADALLLVAAPASADRAARRTASRRSRR